MDSRARAELGAGTTLLKEADVAKLWDDGKTKQILIIENQTFIDYGMAVREIEELGAFLGRQCAELRKSNRKEHRTDPATHLSGMLPKDRILPVRILTIYYEDTPWDAPLDISDLFGPHADMGPAYNENGVTLLEVRNAHLEGLTQEVQDLFELLQLRNAASGKAEFRDQLTSRLITGDVSQEAVETFSRLIGSTYPIHLYNRLKYDKKGAGDMSLSIAEWEHE